jgi:acyl-[acyl-carrier-protein] desaturase
MSKRSTMAHMEDFFYRELLKYLMLAEEKRRWNVFKDIPWDRANPNSQDTLAHCVETFCAVEMYLPDFTSKLLEMIRQSRGRAWFHINWGYEESKHSLALEAWLLASGHRTEDQRAEVERELLGFEWELPFDHPRQMVCYTMIQELATFWNYRNLEKMAAKDHDIALVTALRVISVDERVHYNFFRNTVKEWMKLDEAGTVADLKYVFDNFTMPGATQIPRYDESARILAKTGIYGPREYIKLVKNPILEDLKLDKNFNKMESEDDADKARKARETEALKREQIAVGNGHAVPKNSSPLNGKPTPLNSHAIGSVLSNLNGDDTPEIDGEGPKKSPFLQMIGVEPKPRAASSSVIMAWEADAQKLPGSRGMDKYDELDQKLMVIGDEKSNNAEEMRVEREEIKRTRVKNNRLLRKYDND